MGDLEKNLANNYVIISGELSYVGRNWKEISRNFDEKFDKEWGHCWFFDDQIQGWWDVLKLYEEGYYEFLKANSEIREWLVKTASEVYDIEPSNVKSRLNYAKQESSAMHYQDISIRRALIRLKLEELLGDKWDQSKLPEIKIFYGDHLVQVRGPESEGFQLNPGKVPFHKPEMIPPHTKSGWWEKNSIEDFYQSTKVLLVNSDKLKLQIFSIGEKSCFLKYGKNQFYHTNLDNPHFLNYIKDETARKQTKDEGCLIIESERMPYSRIKSMLTALSAVQ